MLDPISRREAAQRLALLFGGALSAPTLAGLLGGCRAGGGPDYAYAALTTDQQALTGRLVDLIIPDTDTPGARAAGVPGFIDKMLADWLPDDERARFLAGLADVDARAQRAHQRPFVDLDDAQQAALLTTLDREAYAEQAGGNANVWSGRAAPDSAATNAQSGRTGTTARADTTGPEAAQDSAAAGRAQSGTAAMEEEAQSEVGQTGEPGSGEQGGDPNARPPAEAAPDPGAPAFFRVLKELTLAGYYTSEIGATQELRWLAAPGRYDADVPLASVNDGRAWA